MKFKLWSSLFLGLPLIFSAPSAYSQTKKQSGLEKAARAGAEGISKAVQYTADKIDMTLAGKRYTHHANDSRATLSQLATWTEGGVFKTSTDFGLNLRLPNVEKHWQLRFSSYDEEQEERDMNQRRVRTQPRERQYGTSLFFLQKLGNVRVTFQPKLQLKDPLDLSYVLRFESEAELKTFSLVPKLELFADATKGTGEYFSLAFVWRLRKTLELSFENEEEYREKDLFFTTRHGLALDYAHDQRNAFGTAIVASSENHPFHLVSLNYSISHTYQVYKKLLAFTSSPFLSFAKPFGFKGKAGISFNLTATF